MRTSCTPRVSLQHRFSRTSFHRPLFSSLPVQALTNLDDILSKSDSMMVARGDLGVECGPERVPFAQKYMIAKARAPPVPCSCSPCALLSS